MPLVLIMEPALLEAMASLLLGSERKRPLTLAEIDAIDAVIAAYAGREIPYNFHFVENPLAALRAKKNESYSGEAKQSSLRSQVGQFEVPHAKR